MNQPTVMMAEMTWPEFGERLASDPIVFLPTGMLEQHGPHLPMGVDHLLPTAIAAVVAREVDGIVAPPVNYGYKSMPRTGGGPSFPGSTGLDGATLSAVVRDIIRELARHGVRRICVIDGHFENLWFLNEGIDLAMRDVGATGLRVMCLQHWEFLTRDTLDAVFPEGYPGIELEHAAVLETSLMMHFYPELVRMDRIPDNAPMEAPPYDVWPARREWVPETGSLTSAAQATPEKGMLMVEQYRRDMVAAVRREFLS
ncbi:creatinine amidohydrolase [Modicisalibacter ilicicola DSM 19980]|uniref:Creatinine amidohydrolase n=1 Tax=Modicisalibacter ilicicola DSM 19980 TaxID=1121942 RepID=A0A1M4W6V5_9GAMM|nr:creatininase [Halomonas ilicicola]SHE76875.1 creatinine amidohydrolase [Halomonas ilicicola DSM 19980]